MTYEDEWNLMTKQLFINLQTRRKLRNEDSEKWVEAMNKNEEQQKEKIWKEFEQHYKAIYQLLLQNVSRETDKNQCHIKLKELEFWVKHHLQAKI